MDLLSTIKDTPIPSLLVIGGLLFLFIGIATIKKPIVIEITPSSKKIAILLGFVLLIFGNGLYLLPEPKSAGNTPMDITSSTPIVGAPETPSLASLMPDPKKYYLIRSVVSQKVLTIENSAVVQSDWVNNSNQKWIFQPLEAVDKGYYLIRSASTGDCLDFYDSQLDNDANVISYPCANQKNQKWRLVLSDTGVFYFEAKHSNKVMDVPNSQMAAGIQIIQYSYQGSKNQQWILTEVEP